MNETITQTSTIVRCNSPTKNTLPSLKLLSLILYYTRSIKCYNHAQKEIQDNRLKQLQLRIKKMKYERESDQKIQEYIQEEERTYKLRFTDPFFDEDFFFSENRDILTLQILSYFISHPNQHVDEKILIAHIEKKKISAIGSIKDSPLLSDIRKIVYIMIECGIISQHVRTENVTRKILTWQMRNSLHDIFTTAQTHIINELKEDIHSLEHEVYFYCHQCNPDKIWTYDDMITNNGRCNQNHLLQPIDQTTRIEEKRTYLDYVSTIQYNANYFKNPPDYVPFVPIINDIEKNDEYDDSDSGDDDISSADLDTLCSHEEHTDLISPYSPSEFSNESLSLCEDTLHCLNTISSQILLMPPAKTIAIDPIFDDVEFCLTFKENVNICLFESIPISVSQIENDSVTENPIIHPVSKSISAIAIFEEEKQELQKICDRFNTKFGDKPMTFDAIMQECQKINPNFLQLYFKNSIAPISIRLDIFNELGIIPITFLVVKKS